MTTAVHVVVPAGIDDPARPSGGNAYDRRVCRGLAAAGWTVHVHEVPGSWPWPDAPSYAALADALSRIPDRALVLVDGLVASPAPEVLVPEARRLRLVVLVHMPLGEGTADDGVREREGAVLSAAASVVTTSAWARRVLLQLYGLPVDRVHVAEPGVDAAELAPGTATAGALLSVAAVIPGKGHDVLLDALATLTGLRWQCLCVGSLERDPMFVERLRRRVAAGGMERPGALLGPAGRSRARRQLQRGGCAGAAVARGDVRDGRRRGAGTRAAGCRRRGRRGAGGSRSWRRRRPTGPARSPRRCGGARRRAASLARGHATCAGGCGARRASGASRSPVGRPPSPPSRT